MAIQAMRDKSEGVIAKIIVGLIIVVFALFGFGSITTFLAPVPKVATVAGEDVTQQEMEVAVERTRRLLMAQGTNPAEIDEDELRRDILENLINRKLLSVTADELGLRFSDASLDAEIVATEAFQIDGVFNPDQFQMVLGGAGYTPLTYRDEMRADKKLQQLTRAVRASAFLPGDAVLHMSSLAQQTRDVAWLRIDTEALAGKVTVTDDEVESWYDNHPSEFMTEETVNLAYVELNRAELLDDVEVTEEALRAEYERTRDLYTVAESRRVAHILVETNDEVSEEEARARADEVYAQLADGADFAELAREYSDDPGSASEGGDLGFNAPGTFVEEFETAAAELETNEVTEPVLTRFGYHIIKLLEVEEAVVPEFAEVRDQVERAYREQEAEALFVELSGRLSELAYEAPDLQEPAAELGLEIRETGPVSNGDEEGLGAEPVVMEAAYSTDVLLDGHNSLLLELDENHHMVIRMIEHKTPELQPLDAVRDEVVARLTSEKATELARRQANEIVAMLEEGAITRYVADQYGLEWQVVAEAGRNAVGIDPAINREAFRLARPPAGSKSVGSTILADGDAAVISVTNVVNLPEDQMVASEQAGLARVLARQQGSYEYREFRDALAATADISRNVN